MIKVANPFSYYKKNVSWGLYALAPGQYMYKIVQSLKYLAILFTRALENIKQKASNPLIIENSRHLID